MRSLLSHPVFVSSVLIAITSSCSLLKPSPAEEAETFTKVQAVLETNCVHCHGKHHYVEMPALTSTQSLAGLIGPGRWIVPGKPEESRFYKVVTFPADAWGSMPPTGHKISKAEARTLRKWIEAGAKVPAKSVPLHPRGDLPLAP